MPIIGDYLIHNESKTIFYLEDIQSIELNNQFSNSLTIITYYKLRSKDNGIFLVRLDDLNYYYRICTTAERVLYGK